MKKYFLLLLHNKFSFAFPYYLRTNYINIIFLQAGISYRSFVRDIYEDLTQKLINSFAEENPLVSQPCRDNTLYFVKLVDEILISELGDHLPVCRLPHHLITTFNLH